MGRTDSTDPKLRVRNATKVYHTSSGELMALSGCDIDIAEHEIVSIVGPSGCGKTTLLWALSGLHPLSAGTVHLDEMPITSPHPEISMVFQDANLLPWRDLERNILFPFEIKGQVPDSAWIEHLIERVGLKGFERRMPGELSGGMQQRAAIVRALSFNPSVLLMDEPFGALDAFTREDMNRLVEEIWLETRKTIVFITHDIEEAIFLSDKVVVLTPRPGRVAGLYDVTFPRPRSPEVMASRDVFDLVHAIRMEIMGKRGREARAQGEAAG